MYKKILYINKNTLLGVFVYVNLLYTGPVKQIWQFKVMEYLTYLGVFIIPLYVNINHWFPFSTPKAILIYFFASVMLGLFSWGLIDQKVNQDISISIAWVHVVLILFLIILTIGAMFGVDPHNSFFGVWSQSISLSLLYALSIFACLIGFLIREDRSVVRKILTISFLAGIMSVLISYSGADWVPLSKDGLTMGNSSFAGAYLLFNVCFGIGLLFSYKKNWQKIIVGIGLLIILFSPIFFNKQIFQGIISLEDTIQNPLLLMGEANGAVVGVVVSILVIITMLTMRSHKRQIQIIGFAFFMIILGGIFYAGNMLINPGSRINQMFIEEKNGNRFLFWDIANSGFVENPLIGNGFNNYVYTFQNNFTNDFFKPGFSLELWTNQPHNMFWEYMSNTGILGTVSFFTLLVVVFVGLYIRNKDNEDDYILRMVIAASLIGYFIQNMFVFDVPVTYFILFLIIGISTGVTEQQRVIIFQRTKFYKKIIGGVLLVVSLGCIIIFTILPWRESKKWYQMSSQKVSKSGFEEVLNIQKISLLGGVADSAFLVDKTFAKYQKEIIQTVTTTKDFSIFITAEKLLEQELEKQPLNFRARVTLVRVMIMRMTLMGTIDRDLWDRAYYHALQIKTLNPQHPDGYLLQGHLQVLIRDFKQARAMIRAGIVTAPNYFPGYAIARDINKLGPDDQFLEYVAKMENEWTKGGF